MPRKCPVCRSKEWYKQPASGLLICSEGHVLQNYRNETSERAELGPHMVKQRRLKSLRKKRQGVQEDEIVYYGPQARYLYFEALQLILRMQVSFVIKEWNLPNEFELICRDIWALHLNLSRRPPQPEPYLVRQDEINPQDDDEIHVKGTFGPTFEPNPDSNVKAPEGELANLVKDMSEEELFDDEDDDEDEDANTVKFTGTAARRRKMENEHEGPAGNIAVLMLACWLLRVPVMYIDVIRLIEAYKLPYLEAVRLLPEGLTKHLTQANKNNLSPYGAPSVFVLHSLTSRLATNVWTKNGIHTAEMNVGWVLWRIVKRMGGNATLYKLVKMMAMELNLPMTLAPELAPEMTRKQGIHGKRMKGDKLPVEVSLMAALIIVLKLKYEIQGDASDGREEDRKIGLVLVEDHGEMVYLDCGKNLAMNELNDEEVDGYLDFCERALLPRKTEDKTVSEFFPEWKKTVENSPDSSNDHSCSSSNKVAGVRMADRKVAGPISIFHFADSTGLVPEPYSRVLGVAARFVGIGVEELGGVVESFERRLVRFHRRDPEQSSLS